MTMTTARPALSAIRSFAATILCAATLTGCLRTLETEGELLTFGAIVLKGANLDQNIGETLATGVFFRAYSANVPNSRAQPNTCQTVIVDTTTRIATGQLQAGSTLSLQVGNTGSPRISTIGYVAAGTRYESLGAISYVTGDSGIVTIPGQTDGFPSGVIKVRLAEPLNIEDVTIPAAGGSMAVRWNASTDDSTTAAFVILKYANPATSPFPNESIICSLIDDGAHDFPSTALGPFLSSPASMRTVAVTRWRTATASPAEKTLLHIVSTIESTATLR
jgi:hypothetical protein